MNGRVNPFIRSLLQSPWTLLAVAVRSVGTLSVLKIISLQFGASGLALFSHFQNLISLLTQIPEQGTNLAVIRMYSETEESRKRTLIGTSFILNCVVFVILGLVLIFFRDFFLRQFRGMQDQGWYFWMILAAVFFVLLNSLVLAFIYARQSFRLLFGITVANILILVLCVFWGSLSGEILYTLMGFAAGWAMYSVLNFIVLTWKGELPSISLSYDPVLLRNILEFVGIAVVGVLMGKWIDFFIRDFSLEWFGSELTGYWQAQVKISESYRSVFLGTIGVIFFSQISRMERDSQEFTNYCRRMLMAAFATVIVGLLLVWLLKRPVILLLFQEALLPAADFIQFQLLGDLFALPSFLLVYLIIIARRWFTFVIIHILSALIYILAVSGIIGFTDLGVASIPMANLVRFILFFAILIVLLKKDLKLWVRK